LSSGRDPLLLSASPTSASSHSPISGVQPGSPSSALVEQRKISVRLAAVHRPSHSPILACILQPHIGRHSAALYRRSLCSPTSATSQSDIGVHSAAPHRPSFCSPVSAFTLQPYIGRVTVRHRRSFCSLRSAFILQPFIGVDSAALHRPRHSLISAFILQPYEDASFCSSPNGVAKSEQGCRIPGSWLVAARQWRYWGGQTGQAVEIRFSYFRTRGIGARSRTAAVKWRRWAVSSWTSVDDSLQSS
jgi:hypothetical protein